MSTRRATTYSNARTRRIAQNAVAAVAQPRTAIKSAVTSEVRKALAKASGTKYHDFALTGVMTSYKAGGLDAHTNRVAESDQWFTAKMGTNPGMSEAARNSVFSGLKTGSNIDNREGNKIDPKWISYTLTVTAAAYHRAAIVEKQTGGEEYNVNVTTAEGDEVRRAQYVRTSWKVVFLKKTGWGAGSTTPVKWTDVFKTTNGMGGIHSEIRLDKLGEYKVLKQHIINLDADDPQRCLTGKISGDQMGTILFNNELADATTNKDIIMVAACMVGDAMMKDKEGDAQVEPPMVVVTGRVGFGDPLG